MSVKIEMTKLLCDVVVDAVRINDIFRLCYGGTEEIVLLAPELPLDKFETVLDPDAASQFKKVWLLGHRADDKPFGYQTKGQALRVIKMCQEAKIEVMSLDEK